MSEFTGLDTPSLLQWFGGTWRAVPLLSLLWAANFCLAGFACAGRKQVLLFIAELVTLVALLGTHQWPNDSGTMWVIGNVLTSVGAAGAVAKVLRRHVPENVQFSAVHVLKIGYPLIFLAAFGNLCLAAVRHFTSAALLGP